MKTLAIQGLRFDTPPSLKVSIHPEGGMSFNAKQILLLTLNAFRPSGCGNCPHT